MDSSFLFGFVVFLFVIFLVFIYRRFLNAILAALLSSVLTFFVLDTQGLEKWWAPLIACAVFVVVFLFVWNSTDKSKHSRKNREGERRGIELIDKRSVKRPNVKWPALKSNDASQVFRVDQSSGFIVDAGFWKRILVTANHCVDGAVRVELRNEWFQSEAEVIATDPQNDLALLKIKKRFPRELKSRYRAKLRPPEADLKLGETVVVLGYPEGQLLQNQLTVNRGIVSGLRGASDKHEDHFMFDAAIQEGNSGGPVLTSRGEAIGVVSRKSMLPAHDNIGFASRPRALADMFARNGLRIKQLRMGEKSTSEIVEYAKYFVVQLEVLSLENSFPEQQLLPNQASQAEHELKEEVKCPFCEANLFVRKGYRGSSKCSVCGEPIVITDD